MEYEPDSCERMSRNQRHRMLQHFRNNEVEVVVEVEVVIYERLPWRSPAMGLELSLLLFVWLFIDTKESRSRSHSMS